jgi:hypothetical protein
MDAHPDPQRLLNTRPAPEILQFVQSLAHGDGHLDAGERVLLDALGLGIAEEDQDRVAHVLVDGRAVIEGDPGHFREIVVYEVGELFGFHAVGGLGEPGDV